MLLSLVGEGGIGSRVNIESEEKIRSGFELKVIIGYEGYR